MAETSQLASAIGPVRVGTTGTVSSLMTRELQSMNHIQEASGSSSKKCQSALVYVPCGSTPSKLQARQYPQGEGSSNSNNNKNRNGSICKDPRNVQKQRKTSSKDRLQNEMLSKKNTTLDGKEIKGKPDKKRSSYIVEVVDLKCNNPMSSRLKKLGFSRLSESVV